MSTAVRILLGLCAAALISLSAPALAGAGVFGSVGEFGERGSGDAQFDNPQHIAVDQVTGRIYVLDLRARRQTPPTVTGYIKVKVFNADGTTVDPVQTITLADTLATIPDRVNDLAVDGVAGVLYLAVQSRNSADQRGRPAEVWQVPLGASGSVTPKKYVLDNGTPTCDPTSCDPPTDPSTADDLNSARALAVDVAGNRVYVAGDVEGSQSQTVWRIAPTVGGTGSVSTAPVNVGTLSTILGATAMAFAQSKLYLVGQSNTSEFSRVITLSPTFGSTGHASLDATPPSGQRPFDYKTRSLAVEPSGALLISSGHSLDEGGENTNAFGVSRYTSLASTAPEKYWGNSVGTGACQFTRPADLAFNQQSGETLATDGEVQALAPASSGIRRIQRFKAGGSDCGFESAKADFTVSPNPTSAQPTTLDAATSQLPTSKPAFVGSFTTYRWDLDNNASTGAGGFEVSSASPTVVQTFPKGSRTVRLQVEVTGGETAEFSRTFTVKGPSPTAAFSVTPASPRTGETVTFDGASSTPAPDGSTIATYRWDFDGNGTYDTPASASPLATTTYSAARSYRVRLLVTDSGGETDTEDKTVTVSAPPAPPAPPVVPTPPSVIGQGQTPPDLLAPRITLGQRTITADKKGVIGLALSCPADEKTCAFDVALRTAKPVGSGKRKKVLALGRVTVVIVGGKSAVATVKLSRAGATLLRKSKRLQAAAVITVRDAAQNTATQTLTVTLRAAGKSR